MNIGRELVSAILNGRNSIELKFMIESGMNETWLDDIHSGSQVIFTGIDKDAYRFIIKYYQRHHVVPAIQVFRLSFPEETYQLTSNYSSIEELVDLSESKVKSFLIANLISSIIDLHDKSKIDEAVILLRDEAEKISQSVRTRKHSAEDITDPEFNLSRVLDRTVEMGVPFGIDVIDEEFFGFQPGQLIALMGRQKSGKSWATLNSAINAWKEGYTVLFFSVEMDVSILRDRIYCLGANVSPSRMKRGKLTSEERKRVEEFHHQFIRSEGEEGRFFISKKRSLITVDDVREEILRYNPNIVYIDGFSFMVDKKTGKMTSDWQANENVAYELKGLAMDESMIIFVNTQVREKQYVAKNGIEARLIASGTGLLQAGDLIIGQDKDGPHITFNCVYSRFEYFPDVIVEVDWETMDFLTLTERLEELGV